MRRSPAFRTCASATGALAALLLAALPQLARADLAVKLDGSCPSGYTLGQDTHGKPRCYSPRDIENQNKAAQAKQDKGSGKSPSSSSGSSGGYAYVPPTKGSLPKSSPLQNCPSGYYSNNAGTECLTHWDEAPATAARKGACPNGTVEEWGAWCTAALKDSSDKTLDQLDGYAVRDFNNVYLAHQLAGKPVPSPSLKPAVLQQAIAARQAAGEPWRPRHEREREAEKAQQAAAQKAESEITADAGGEVKDAAKALGSALKGLFGR